MRALLAWLCILLAPVHVMAQAADDRHEGYYYPGPVSEERYSSRAEVLDRADRGMRLAFVTGHAREQLQRTYWPPHVLFAKGEEAEKMLVVATGENSFHTLYQARAVLAQMTAIARGTPLFRDLQVSEIFTFFDLAKMMGFRQITISDGARFSHRIIIE